jgi:hypothetical protein
MLPFFSTFFFNLFLDSTFEAKKRKHLDQPLLAKQEKGSIWINLYLRSKKKVEEKG